MSSCQIIFITFTCLFLIGSRVEIVLAQRPSNDRCIDSIALVEGKMVNGDNSNANYDYNNQGVCGARSDRRAIWYEINGVGKEVTVNICTNNGKLTDFGIFRACNTQNCLGAPPQQLQPANCDDQESNTHSFLAKTGDNYYVHVRSDVVFEGEGSNFTIWYTEPTDASTLTPESNGPSSSSPSSVFGGSLFYNTIVSAIFVIGLSLMSRV